MASLKDAKEATAATNELSNVLWDVHAKNLAAYSRLLSKERRDTTTENESIVDEQPFWDIVVVTAGDKQQRHCYQQRIDQKLSEGTIPTHAQYVTPIFFFLFFFITKPPINLNILLCDSYLVIEDPPNSKIGSGGSTCLVMKILQEKFPADFLLQGTTDQKGN